MNRRVLSHLALAVGLSLSGGFARGQEADVSPTATPVATPPPEVTPTPEAAPPPEVTPTPEAAPPPEVTPTPEAAPASPVVPPGQPAAPAPVPSPPAAAAAPALAAPVPAPAVATPTPAPPGRITDPAVLSILQAPSDNPFGVTAQVPASPPAKLTFVDATVSANEYVSVRVDPTGKPVAFRLERDPISSLAGEVQRSLARWTFEAARGAAGPVETWAALRLDLAIEIDAPRSVQSSLTMVTPSTPVPRPLAWTTDEAWLASRKPGAAGDGMVLLENVDNPPMPRKTPWSATSYKGPFSAKFWVHVKASGVVDKAIPLEASDPVLIGYLRRSMTGWTFRPAQANGAGIDSWNELSLSGQVSYSVDLKQIASLRKSLGGS